LHFAKKTVKENGNLHAGRKRMMRIALTAGGPARDYFP
jgi:hypothetical protein